MSKTVDERVVEMRFDNKQFESNVQTSMSTLDKLKQKLNLSGASKGLENINTSAKNVNMSGLASGVETVRAKFSALEVIGVTALANITNSAVNAGKHMIKALTLDPVISGFKEYETQINAVQTILANTSSKGTTLDQVNDALDELNHYADLTIYNFTEMTRNIGTFTAAGVDLETSVSAIQGIANLAAVSGSTSQQASTAMYQLSQALASGTVKLMDWNSVVNAGMGGEVFQNALRETSELLGTGAEAAIKAEGSFRESLSTGWLTSEVLTETLKKFTTSGANEYVAKYTGLSEKAVKAALEEAEARYGEADAIDQASKALAKKSGKNADEIKDALQMAKTAEDAATKVKTFSQLMDTLKEAIQSGWTQTWEILIGDFEEAKDLFSSISDFLGGVIQKASDARNNLLESALGKGFTGLAEKVQGFIKPVKEAANVVTKVKDSVQDLDKVVNNVIRGDFGNGQERINKLTEAGQNYYKVQNKVNEALGNSFRYSDKQVEAQEKLLGSHKKSTKAKSDESKETTKLTDEEKNRIKILANMSEEQLKSKGYTDEQIAAFRELGDTAKKLGIPLNEFIDNLDEINGRWLLIDSFKNIGKSLVKVFSAIGQAWRETFKPVNADQVFNLVAAFHKLTSKLVMSDENADKLKRTFKGLFALLDLVRTIAGGGLKLAFTVLSSILRAFDMNVLDLTAAIGDAIVKFRTWLKSHNLITKAVKVLISGIKSFVSTVKECVNAFMEIPAVNKAVTIFKTTVVNAFKAVKNAIKNLIDGISDGSITFGSIMAKFAKIGKNMVQGLKNGFLNNPITNFIADIANKIIDTMKNVLGIHSPSVVFFDMAVNCIKGFLNGLKSAISYVLSFIKDIAFNIIGTFADIFNKVPWDKILNVASIVVFLNFVKKVSDAFGAISNAVNGVGDVLSGVGKVLDKSAKGIGKILENTAKVVKSFSKVMNSVAFSIKMKGIKDLAIGIGILVLAVIALTFIDGDKLKSALINVGILAGVLVGLAVLTDKMSSASATINKNGVSIDGMKSSILKIGAAILLLGLTVKMLGNMDPDKAQQGFHSLLKIVLALSAFILVYGKVVKKEAAQNIDKAGKMIKKLATSVMLIAIVIKLLGSMDTGALNTGINAVLGIGVIIAGLIWATKYAGNNINSVGSTILKISIAIGLMATVVKSMGKLETGPLIKGLIVVGILGGFIVGLIAATKLITKEGTLASLGMALIGMAAAIGVMGLIIRLIGNMDAAAIVKGVIAVAALSALVAGLVWVTKKFAGNEPQKLTGVLIGVAVAIGVMAAVVALIGQLNTGSLTKGLIAVGIMAAILAILIVVSKDAKDCKGNLIAMTAAMVAIAASVAILSLIEPNRLAGAVTAMGVLMAIFAVMIAIAGKSKGATGSLLALAGVILVIGGVLLILTSMIKDMSKAVEAAVMLGVLIAVLVAAVVVLDKMGGIGGAAALLVVSVALVAIAAALLMLSQVPFDALVRGLGALVVALVAIAVVSLVFNALAVGVLLVIGVLLMFAVVAVAVAASVVILAAGLALIGLALPLLADGLETLVTKVAACSNQAGGFLKVMLSVAAGLAVLGIGAIVAAAGLVLLGAGLAVVGLGVAVLGVGLLVVAAALLVGAAAALVFGVALYMIADAFSLLSNNGQNILTCLLNIAGGLLALGAGAIVAGVGLAILAVGMVVLSVAFVAGAAAAIILAVGVGILSVAIIIGAAAVFLLAAAFGALGEAMNVMADGIEAGANLVAGFAQGIANGISSVIDTVKNLASSAIDGICDFLGIHSPSVVAQEIGKFFGDGFALGIDDSTENVSSSAEGLGSAAKDSMGKAGTEGGQSFSTGLTDGIDLSSINTSSFDSTSFNDSLKNLGLDGGDSLTSGIGDGMDFSNVDMSSFGGEDMTSAFKNLGLEGGDSFTSGLGDGMDFSNIDMSSFGGEDMSSMFNGFGLDSGSSFTSGLGSGMDSASMSDSLSSMLDEASSKEGDFFKAGEKIMKAFKSGIDSAKSSLTGTFQKPLLATLRTINEVSISGFKKAGSNLIAALKGGISLAQPSIVSAVQRPLTSAASSINTVTAPGFKNAGKSIMSALKDGINSNSTSLTATIQKQLKSAMLTINNVSVSGFRSSGKKISESFESGLKSGIPSVSASVMHMLEQAYRTVESKQNKFLEVGSKLMSNLARGISQKTGSVTTAVRTAVSSACSAISSQYTTFYNQGIYLGSGLVLGINSKQQAAYNAGYALGQMAAQGEKDGQKSNSPSKLTIQYGKWLGEGLVIGIEKMNKSVYSAGYNMGETATNTISKAVSRISDMMDTSIDSQPTIRPVVDLSNVQSSADTINGMFGINPSIGLLSNVGAIDSMMNASLQNGANDDVVSAINKLNKNLENVGGNSYVIDGITYDDGSNITDAVQSLVRAARVERRV